MEASEQQINALGRALDEGKFAEVGRELKALNTSKIPRHLRAKYTELCFRVGDYNLGLRILAVIVRPSGRKPESPATASEIVQYAACLIFTGSIDEALKLLEPVDFSRTPQALIFQAYAHMIRWSNQSAVECFEKLFGTPGAEFNRLLQLVNYSSALQGTDRYEDSIRVADEVISACSDGSNEFRRMTALFIRARAQIAIGNYNEARADLDLVATHYEHKGSRWLAVRKELAYIEALETRSDEPLLAIRREAVAANEWIMLREIDLNRLRARYDEELFCHLYFGTPQAEARKRILQVLRRSPSRRQYVYGNKAAPRFDLATGALEGREILKPGKKVHQLLSVLVQDFYSPVQLQHVFAGLFPGEYFNVESSPGRVHQLILRTRRWLEDEKLPVEILETNGQYRLSFTAPFSIRVHLGAEELSSQQIWRMKLLTAFPEGTSFTAKQAREELGLAATTLKKFMAWAIENRYIERAGENRSTTYRMRIQSDHQGKPEAA